MWWGKVLIICEGFQRLEQIVNVGNREGVWTGVMLTLFFFPPLISKSLSNEENLKLFGKCNNPNGHGHNYKGERKMDAILALSIRVEEYLANIILMSKKSYGQNSNALSLEWKVKWKFKMKTAVAFLARPLTFTLQLVVCSVTDSPKQWVV